MMESITAYLNRIRKPDSRKTSDATTVTANSGNTGTEEPKVVSAEDRELGVSPVASLESQTTPSDPFAGGVEGGVTYRSLNWWYVSHIVEQD